MQWLRHRVFTLECICVYGLSVRTNNDTEGYNTRLRLRARRFGLVI